MELLSLVERREYARIPQTIAKSEIDKCNKRYNPTYGQLLPAKYYSDAALQSEQFEINPHVGQLDQQIWRLLTQRNNLEKTRTQCGSKIDVIRRQVEPEPWRVMAREICTRLLTTLPLEIREMIYRELLPEFTMNCNYSHESVQLRWLRFGPELTGDFNYWRTSPWAEQVQIPEEMAQVYLRHTDFHFHEEDICKLPAFLTKQLWLTNVAPAKFLRNIELFALCSFSVIRDHPYNTTFDNIHVSKTQKILRAVLPGLLRALPRQCQISVRLQSRTEDPEDLHAPCRLEMRCDLAFLAQPLWDLLLKGHQLKLSFWDSEFDFGNVIHMDGDIATECDIFQYDLGVWAKVR